jgi:hypothetical protein
MKSKILFALLLGFSLIGKSQSFDIGFGLGTGTSYIFESKDESVDIDYALPFSAFASLKYIPQSSYFDYKLNFQFINTGIVGRNWESGRPIDGEVSSFTTSLLLEHLNDNKTWNFGYNFGFGYTTENYIEDLDKRSLSYFRKFMSITISGLLSVKVSEKLSLQLIPSFIWTDPVNSFRSADKWYIAGEDLNFLAQIGISYRLK